MDGDRREEAAGGKMASHGWCAETRRERALARRRRNSGVQGGCWMWPQRCLSLEAWPAEARAEPHAGRMKKGEGKRHVSREATRMEGDST